MTIARFRARHEQALADFLVQSLRLCAAAGMVKVGVVALDDTKLAGNAADKANCTLDRLEREVAEILRQAADADQRDGLEHDQARGDELPEALASEASRLARLRQAKAQLEAEAAKRARRFASGSPPAPRRPPRRQVAAHPQATDAGRGTQPQGDRQCHRP